MPPKTDAEIIDGAYEASVSQLYGVFFNAMVTAQSEQEKGQAAQAFHEGVKLARAARQKAKELL